MKKVKLKDIAIVISGQSPKSIYYNTIGDGYKFLQGSRTFGYIHPTYNIWTTKVTKLAPKNSVLISVRAPVGDLNIADYDVCIGRGVYSLVAKNKNNKFIYYALKNIFPSYSKNISGTTFSSINKDQLLNIEIIAPTQYEIQQKISSVLCALDKRIEINNKINEQLEVMAKFLYDYWFVQFDFPDENGKPYFSSGGKMKFSPELKREIPVEWEVKNLQDIFYFDKGIEPGQSNYLNNKSTDNHILFYRVADINSIPSIYVDKSNINKSKIAKIGDCLVSFDGSVGKVSNNINGAFCSGLQKISDKTGLYNNSICYFIFNDKNIQSTIKKYATGSIILHASKSIKYLQIPYCESKYILFQNTINDLYKKIINNKKQNQQLSQIRDWLLPMLMNGQIGFKK